MSSALSPSDLGEEACQGNIDDFLNNGDPFLTNQSSTLTGLTKDIVYGNDSITMVSQDGFDVAKPIKTIVETADGEHRNLCAPGSDVNSPRDMVSPSAGSSDFSAMESDGEGIETGMDDASLSGIGDMSFQRSNGYYGASTPLEYTTTPCASSSACDDDYESPGSRKKRRRTRREMPHPSYNATLVNGGLSSLRFARATTQEPWQHDPETSPFSPPTCTKAMNFNFAENSSRRSSGGGSATAQITRTDNGDENAKRPRTCTDSLNGDDILNIGNAAVKLEVPTAMDTPVSTTKSGTRRHHTHSHHRNAGPAEVEQILHKQYPRKIASYELRIVTQPESQHRARYLTEGSRGPVKDSAQRGFPEVELVGYDGPAILQVFVATDSGKVKPHGFYQACRVTGRNTSACEEMEIEGTKVIKIPFKPDGMLLSIDCVGILKLRNTDVEVRTGIRNQKRNQSVRLAFRVSFSPDSGSNSVVLQTSSSRISCTQPLGQPEITKKSVDRCSVEGGIEMFIIGKNFHRGTKVLYQDPEDPDGKQWCAEGDVDKDTFHQSHMVVRVPPYHDQEIQKPVNVQLSVEFQDKSCEPHSFTYTPRQKEPEATKNDPKKSPQTQTNIETSNIESALNLLDGAIDKKFLVALFSKLLTGGMTRQPDSPGTSDAPELAKPEPHTQPAMVNAATFTNPRSLINVAAAPLLQGMVQPQLQTHTVVTVASSEPLKTVVNFVNPSPNPAAITSNQFANVQFNLQPSEMSFTEELNSAGPPPASGATPVVSPVSQMIFNPATSTVISLPASHVSFNPTLRAGIANPAPVSQINSNPPINGGLATSVFPSVGILPAVFDGSNFKIKSEMPLPEIMPNVSPTIQTIPIMASTTSQQPAFRGVTQTLPALVGYALPAQDPSPPLVVSPVSQSQLGQGGILYNSFSAALTNAAPMFGSASAVSFAGDTLTKINQSSGNSFANVSVVQGHIGSPSLPQTVVFADSGITSTPAQQMQTQTVPNFQESPGQQMQQQHILAAVPASQGFINQAQPQFVANTPPVSQNPGNVVQSPISVATFVPSQMLICPDSMQQVTTSFESSFVDKKPNQYTIEANQNSKVQTVQSPNEPSSQQFSVPASQQHLQQQLTNFGSQNQQQFGISVQEQPMQQDQHGSLTGQKEPQQSVGFGISNQHHFSTVVEDHPMPRQLQQQPIVATQQQFSIGSQAQQNPVFNNQTQHFSIGLQDPIQQQPHVLPSPQSEISHQTFTVAPQDQTMTQQRPVTQIVHVQQVAQNTSNATQSQDTQMHVDAFVEPQATGNLQVQSTNNAFNIQQPFVEQATGNLQVQSTNNAFNIQQPFVEQATGNLQVQSTNNAFNIQQTVIPSVIQPIEEMPQSTIDRHMKDLSPPQVQQQQQQSFYIQHQPASMPVASEIVGAQSFQSHVAAVPAAISMQPILPASALNVQDFQNIQQPVNASMVAAQEQNFAAPPQVHSPNAPAQNGISAASMPPQIFQNQPTGQNMATEVSNSAPMLAQQYQSPEAVTKSLLSVAAPAAAQGYQAVQASATNSAQMQMYKRADYAYQDSNTAQIQQQGDARTHREGNATLQPQQTLDANSTVRQFEPRSLDLFAMSQLLQSIDGSANLEAISREDVQRHCQ